MRMLVTGLVAAAFVAGCGCKESIEGTPDSHVDGEDTTGEDVSGEVECPDCDDGDPCTTDSCDPVSGECGHDPLDADGDGFAAMVAPDGTSCPGNDCDDTDDSVYPGAPEVCLDGVDQDCDTIVDGPRAMLSTVHLKTVSTGADPALAWTGSEFALAWYELPPDIFLGRVGLDGDLVEDPVQLTDMRWAARPKMAWTGSVLGIVFYNNPDHDGCAPDTVDCYSDIHFMQVGPEADVIGAIQTLNDVDTVGLSPQIVWTGSEFGVFWEDGRDGPCPDLGSCETEIYFTRVGADGLEIGSERRISDGTGMVLLGSPPNAGPVWTGSEFVLPWQRYDGGYVQHLSRTGPDGSPIDDRVLDDAVEALTWSGSRFGAVWADDTSGNYDVYLGFMDPTGTGTGGPVQLTDDVDGQGFPNMEWTGSLYGVVWLDGRDTGCSPLPYDFVGDCHAQIYISILDSAGATMWDDLKITYRDSWKLFTAMTWTGSEFGLAWFEVETEPYDEWYISFDRISFCE